MSKQDFDMKIKWYLVMGTDNDETETEFSFIWSYWVVVSFFPQVLLSLTRCGPVTKYGGGSMLCKNPIFFTMKEFPQI